jgi:4-hydroxyphenylpyruvate dioxygenase
VQLADAPKIDMDLLYWSRHFRNMPGEGDLPVREFMQAVAATGYDGYLSLEIFNDQFRGGSAKAIAVDGHRSLVWLMDQVKRGEPSVEGDVPAMPDRIGVEAVEFVEFATNKQGAAELAKLLGALGFSEAGRHVSKDVALYRQSNINIVVNTGRSGFAHSSFVVHGTSAYAMALRVENAALAIERARALGAEIFEQAVASGELAIPAVRSVGGGLIYFVDDASGLSRLWEVDFRPVEGSPGQDAGLTRIDHVGQTMSHEELSSWLLFYVSLFKATKTPMVDVIDPAGIVRSQVIEGLDKKFRLTLNGAENRRTLAGHFLSETFGSGIQHLALASDDIFATAASIEQNGFAPLTISPNYFDDVEARFGLEPELADRLRAGNILYDRDDQGRVFPALRTSARAWFHVRNHRAARRLSRLWRAQCSFPYRSAKAADAAEGHAKGLILFIAKP